MNKAELTLVILAYNEESGIALTLEDCVGWVEYSGRAIDVLVMNDGSSDRTGVIADEYADRYEYVKVCHQPRNLGQFGNVRSSLSLVESPYVAFIPGDNQFEMASFDMFMPHIGQCDIIFGFPNDEGVRGRSRVLLSYLWRLYLLILFGVSVSYMGGLIVVPVDLMRRIPTRNEGFLGWYETTVRMVLTGATIIQLPFVMRERAGGDSKAVNPLRNVADLTRMAMVWWRIKPPGFFGAGREWSERKKPYQDYLRVRGEQRNPSQAVVRARRQAAS